MRGWTETIISLCSDFERTNERTYVYIQKLNL